MITKKNRTKQIWVDKRSDFAGELKSICKAEGIETYSTLSETKAVFAKRKIRSLKNILYRYMEDYGHKYIHKLSQFVTTLHCRKICTVDLRSKISSIPTFCRFFAASHYENLKKLKYKIGDRVRIARYDLLFRNGYNLQFNREDFGIVAIPSPGPTTYTIKDEQDETIRGKSYQKLIKVI